MSDHIVLDMADYIIGVFTGLSDLDAVKLFIRGSAPSPVAESQVPYVEVDIDRETPNGGCSGNLSRQIYSGDLNLYVSVGSGIAGGDFPQEINRVCTIPSLDLAVKLVRLVRQELEKEVHRDLGQLAWTDGAVTETVLQFLLGEVVYGLDDRTDNLKNFGSIAFTVETQREPVTA